MFMFKYRLEWLVRLMAFKAVKKIILGIIIVVAFFSAMMWMLTPPKNNVGAINKIHNYVSFYATGKTNGIKQKSIAITPAQGAQIDNATKVNQETNATMEQQKEKTQMFNKANIAKANAKMNQQTQPQTTVVNNNVDTNSTPISTPNNNSGAQSGVFSNANLAKAQQEMNN